MTPMQVRRWLRLSSWTLSQRSALQRYHLSELFQSTDERLRRVAQQKLYLRAILPECFHKQLDLRKALTISGTQSLVVWDKVMNRPSWDLLELRRLIDVYHRLCFPSAFLNTTMYNSTKRSVTISRSKFDDLGLAHARLRLYQLTGIMTYLHFDDDYISVWLAS